MFPTGLTEVMGTHPRTAAARDPSRAGSHLLGLDLPEVLRLLDLPTPLPFLPVAFQVLSYLIAHAR